MKSILHNLVDLGYFLFEKHRFALKNLVNFTKTVGKYLYLGKIVFDTRINDLKESVEK